MSSRLKMAKPLCVTVKRIENKLIAVADDFKIQIYCDENFPATPSDDFAAFLFLPIAMRLGRSLRIIGAGDAVTAQNAEQLSGIWELWLPTFFHKIDVSFETDRVTPAGSGSLVLYSGGADSTYNLLTRKQHGESQSLLTVHGLDYGFDSDKQFARLVVKSSPFADFISDEWIKVRTDAYASYRPLGITTGVGHGFALAAALFLQNHRYKTPVISADYTRAQDLAVVPWGTNHVTNDLFASSTYRLETANTGVSRSEKLAALAASPIALDSLSFCGDEEFRPLNCGRCAKCIRTKAMFLATVGHEPPIFICAGLDRKSLRRWKAWKRKERTFFMDFYAAARSSEHLDMMPWYDELVSSVFDRSTMGRFKRQFRSIVSTL
jgi:hypothetical protein